MFCDTKKINIKSTFLEREVDLTSGPHSCALFTKSPDDAFFKASHHKENWGIPFEAAIKINDKWEQIGIFKQKNVLWKDKISVFDIISASIVIKDDKKQYKLFCQSSRNDLKGIEVIINYEVSDRLPYMKKQVTVNNNSPNEIILQNICVELIYSSRIGRNIIIQHDYRQDICDRNRHYIGYHDCQFPDDIDFVLKSEHSIDSFNVYEIFVPDDECGQGVWLGRVLKHLAPWAASPSVIFQCSGIEPHDGKNGIKLFEKIIKQCSETGVEMIMFFLDQIWTNTGDYQIRKDIFQNGEDDLKQLIEYIHFMGMKAGVYCSYSIALHDSEVRKKHLDWECIDSNGTRFDPGAWGNMCFLSGWGEFIKNKFHWLVKELKFDELQVDGPTSIPCCSDSHKHTSIGNYNYLNWLWEKDLFNFLNDSKCSFTIPRGLNYILMGASRIPGGYTEQDFCHDSGIKLLTNYRSSMFEQRKRTPAWACWGFLALGNYHGNSVGADENTPEIFEQGIASLLGYGNASYFSGDNLFYGQITKAVITRWVSFYTKYRNTFSGDFIRLAAPTGKSADAVLLTNPEEECKALIIIFNPTQNNIDVSLILPLKYSGVFSAGEQVKISDVNENRYFYSKIDSSQNTVIKQQIAALQVKTLILEA